MGVYLSSPITDKISNDSTCKNFKYGASSMQGWRMTQEDAHNCLPDFDEERDGAFFAVYDGHGGAEVALYSGMYFPDYVKNREAYKNGEIKEALNEAFLKFDATLIEDDVIKELRSLAGDDEKNAEEEDDGVPMGKTEADLLRQEADMPLDQLLSKYENNQAPPAPGVVRDVRKQQDQILSPAIRPKRELASGEEADSSIRTGSLPFGGAADVNTNSNVSSNVGRFPVATDVEDKLINGHADNENNMNMEKEIQNNLNQRRSEDDTVSSSSCVTAVTDKVKKDDSGDHCVSQSSDRNSPRPVTSRGGGGSGVSCGGDSDKTVSHSGEASSRASSGEAEAVTSGSASSSSLSTGPSSSSTEEPCSGNDAGASGSGCSSSSSGVTPRDLEDDDDDDDEDGEYEAESDEEEEEEEEDDDEDGDDSEVSNTCMDMTNEEPGSDSGCTACVALMVGRDVYVANAGDSRCVLSRGGKAVELSFDHKPEDTPERSRIEKAGGKVTSDGRVNGGLNLSRALGDHFYKRNHALSPEEQMITALPDIVVTTLQDDDEFMVLACDGIWNFMSSQEVVDMVHHKLQDPVKREKLSIICEDMFDYCLAPNTFGDGTGCDNMTCIIITFNHGQRENGSASQNSKRSADNMETSSSSEEKTEKKARVEPESTQDDV